MDSQSERGVAVKAAKEKRRLAYETLGCELGWDETGGPPGDSIHRAVYDYGHAVFDHGRAAGRAELEDALRALVEPLRDLPATVFMFPSSLAKAFVAAQQMLGYGDISALLTDSDSADALQAQAEDRGRLPG